MRALVTGATGLIGSHLVAELRRHGHSVTALLRENSSTEVLEFVVRHGGQSFSEVELLRVDSSDYQALQESFAEVAPDVVYHCAAQVSLGRSSQELIRSNVELTTYVTEACMSLKNPPALVHVGSIASLGSSSVEQNPASEQNIFESMGESSAYGRSKFLCQMEVIRAMKLGLRVVIVNPSVVLGFVPGGKGLQRMMEYCFGHGMVVYTDGGNGFVDVRDVARAMVALSIRNDSWGQSYLLSGANYSFKELIDEFNDISGRRASRFHLGGIWIKIALTMANLAAGKKGANKVSKTSTLTHRSYWDGSKVVKTLSPGFEYRALKESAKYMYLIYSELTKNKS